MVWTSKEFSDRTKLIAFVGASSPAKWPKADKQYASIFEAINIVGHGLFGPDWANTELDVLDWRESPRDLQARLNRKAASQPPLPEIRRTHSIRLPKAVLEPAYDAHVRERYLEIAQRAWEANQSAHRRLMAAFEWLAERCRNGVIASFARLQSGGPLWPMEQYEWNVDDDFSKFLINGGHRRYFSGWKNSGPYDCFVFLERESLCRAVGMLSESQVEIAVIDLEKLSPYLQFAVKLAIAKGYEAGAKIDASPVREAEIRSAWPETLKDTPMSETAVRAIAKVIGFPDPKAIEQGRKAKSGKKG